MHGVDYTVTSDIQTANLMVYLQSYVFIHHLSSCPSPPRLRGSSGPRQGKVPFLHVHDSAPVHPSSCPSLVTSTNGTLSPLLLMEPWVCVFFLLFTFKPADKAQRSAPIADSDQVFSSPRTCFSFYVDAFLACYRANICFVSDCMCFDSQACILSNYLVC